VIDIPSHPLEEVYGSISLRAVPSIDFGLVREKKRTGPVRVHVAQFFHLFNLLDRRELNYFSPLSDLILPVFGDPQASCHFQEDPPPSVPFASRRRDRFPSSTFS